MKRCFMVGLVVVAGCLLLSGCSSGSDGEASTSVARADYLGQWGDRDQADSGHPAYQFVPEGVYRASDGCNEVTGTWKFEDPEVSMTVTDGGHTEGCDDFADVDTVVIESKDLVGRSNGDTVWTLELYGEN